MEPTDPERRQLYVPCGVAGCGSTAAIIEVTRAGARFSKPLHPMIDPTQEGYDRIIDPRVPQGGARLLVEATLAGGFSTSVGTDAAADLWDAVDTGHLELLPKRVRRYFWCTDCGAAFCASHWQQGLRLVFDEAGPDYWVGNCPNGHRAMIDLH